MGSVSVIIPTLNRKALLESTITSVLSQSLPPTEVIIIDQGSTDGTVEWLKHKYRNEVIVVKNTNTNTSPGYARNLGMQIAKGQFIKFFDSDDLMTFDTLFIQHEVLRNSGRGFVYGPYFRASYENGVWLSRENVILHYFPFPLDRTLISWMCRGLLIAIPGMLFRRDLLQEIGPWRDDIITYEDWDYLWRVGQSEPSPAHSNKCAFIYRQHDNQSTQKNISAFKRNQEGIQVMQSIQGSKYFTSLSYLDRKVFLARSSRMIKTYDASFRSSFYDSIWWQYCRTLNKLGRIKTGTDWQPFYGPLKSEERIRGYLHDIIS